MIELKGQGVGDAVAIGPVHFLQRALPAVTRRAVDDWEAEYERFEAARAVATAELDGLRDRALATVGEQGALVFEVHQMMIADEDFGDGVRTTLSLQRVNAEYAVSATGADFALLFAQMDDPYMRERAADVHDISDRLIRCLAGESSVGLVSAEPVIIAADDLSPSETIQLDKSKVLAFVTARGSTTSHSAILARTLGIPAVVGVGDLDENWNGELAVVDGLSGVVVVGPEPDTLERLLAKKAAADDHLARLEALKGQPTVTLDGQAIDLYANIGSPAEVDLVVDNDAGGIGLFRTEFLYMESPAAPTEDELVEAYRTVAERLGGRRVIFRTLDVGADKQIDYLSLDVEENPALGLRGLRLCLDRPDLFQTQLRALWRAAAHGQVAVMFPMVASLWEVQRAKALLAEARSALVAEGVPVGESLEVGIMIETPAAALIADRLALEVDFFSLGTNDLTQYALAVDRQNPRVGEFVDTHHEAILRLIAMVVEHAHTAGRWVGICGELAADVELTETFLRLGVDELSVAPASVLRVRERVRSLDLSGG
jgi:phosphotransferase system enzyme I (PtsI)